MFWVMWEFLIVPLRYSLCTDVPSSLRKKSGVAAEKAWEDASLCGKIMWSQAND